MDLPTLLYLFLVVGGIQVWSADISRHKRETAVDLNPGNWDSCKTGATPPATRVNTTVRVADLRALFDSNGIDAYIIPSEDAHQSEYPSDYDKRREYISGFSGSAGMAIVTKDKQALWTDGRYFLQAEDELDCNWILMRQGETGVPSTTEWLLQEFSSGGKVGASPFLISSARWLSYESALKNRNINMTIVSSELIDKIWPNSSRPEQPNTPINALNMTFAGRTWQDKIKDMHEEMEIHNADVLVVTGLDETAWLFNLRASDISYNPFFISYAIVNRMNNTTRLYILMKNTKLTANPTDSATRVKMGQHLNTGDTGSCSGKTGMCVEVIEYSPDTVKTDVKTASEATSNQVWVSFSCNYAIYSAISQDKIYQANTPAALMKSKKNPVEVEGMKRSHIRDAVALIKFLTKLEKEVKDGVEWTEVSAAEDLKNTRMAMEYNRGLSFSSISGSGSNGAIIHYRPTAATDKRITTDEMYLLDSGGQYLNMEYNRGLSFNSISGVGANGAIIHYAPSNLTDKQITTTEMYLLDSGGQYLDGTTDVTRTFHYGTPTDYEKECYTRVLMGHIDLFQAIWEKGMYGREIDAFARAPLWDAGLVYRHGTGHGIGMYLSVHEGPGRLSLSHASFIPDEPLHEFQFISDGPGRISVAHAVFIHDEPLDEFQFFSDGPGRISFSRQPIERDNKLDEFQFFSDEPGYYEAGKFGIRLENIVMVKEANTTYHYPGANFLTFEHVTLVPYEPNLINLAMLSEKQLHYLNDYHKLCMDIVGEDLKKRGLMDEYNWLKMKAQPVPIPSPRTSPSDASFLTANLVLLLSLNMFAHIVA